MYDFLAKSNFKDFLNFHSIVRELISRDGTIINHEDVLSNTALHLASTHGYYRVVALLLDKGATIDSRQV